MLVMKFGGASVKDAESIRNVAEIIIRHNSEPTLVVISAIGKTTNHLEELAALAKSGNEPEAIAKLHAIAGFHTETIQDLFGKEADAVIKRSEGFYDQINRIVKGILLLEEFPPLTYDRIVAFGELLSTTIVAAYLDWVTQSCSWLDARGIIKTDATHKQANVIWSVTSDNVTQHVLPMLQPGKMVITQGFIGSTLEGKTTTLGREGSDYTASIFAHCLDAEKLLVWKDVKGILNGDPRIREATIKHDELSYEQAVEMTFYGASVIHPKTIKPIFTKQIPLYVKCFKDINEPGTKISEQVSRTKIPSYIVKKDQVFLQIKPRDFSFMDEQLMQDIFHHIYKTGVKVNLIQNSAISLMLCADQKPGPINSFTAILTDNFEVTKKPALSLHTILNFTEQDLQEAEGGIMVQKFEDNLYVVR